MEKPTSTEINTVLHYVSRNWSYVLWRVIINVAIVSLIHLCSCTASNFSRTLDEIEMSGQSNPEFIEIKTAKGMGEPYHVDTVNFEQDDIEFTFYPNGMVMKRNTITESVNFFRLTTGSNKLGGYFFQYENDVIIVYPIQDRLDTYTKDDSRESDFYHYPSDIH